MKIIIGISGKLGSGKNYITTNIILPVLEKYKHRYLELAFADQVKINVINKNAVSYSDVYENKTDKSRQILQHEGTEVGRTFNKDIWISYLDTWIKVHNSRGINTFIISDCRFVNEFDYIKKHGIMIKVISPIRNNLRLLQESNKDRSIYNKISTHRSECDLDLLADNMYNLIIHNDPADLFNIIDLQNKFEAILNIFCLNSVKQQH